MQNKLNKLAVPFSVVNKPSVFYLLAITPFILLAYFYAEWPFPLIGPVYAFIILILKKDKIFSFQEASSLQRMIGAAVVLSSFFLYFVAKPYFPDAVFYGIPSYIVYILGLFIVFLEFHALKEAFSPLFLIVAVFSNSFVSQYAEPLFAPYLPAYTLFVVNIARNVGIPVALSNTPTIVVLNTLKGPLSLTFIWGCVGFESVYLFSVILTVLLVEDPSDIKTKAVWTVIGVVGTIFVNLIRIVTLFATDYFYGYDVGGTVHYYIGYALFLTWITLFFLAFAKRSDISRRIRSIRAKS